MVTTEVATVGVYPSGFRVIEGTTKTPFNLKHHWYPNIDIGAYNFPKEVLPRIKSKLKL